MLDDAHSRLPPDNRSEMRHIMNIPICIMAVPYAVISFFRFDFDFSANLGRFAPATPRNRPCACRNEFIYSERYSYPMQKSACPPVQFELFPTIQTQPNPKINLFSNEGQLRIIFRRIMHRGQELELRQWRSGIWSWVPLREIAVDWFRVVYG